MFNILITWFPILNVILLIVWIIVLDKARLKCIKSLELKYKLELSKRQLLQHALNDKSLLAGN